MPDRPPYPCDGPDDFARRCGYHHAISLASVTSPYQCCCGQPWKGAAKVCSTGARAGDPVTPDDPRETVTMRVDGDLRDRIAEAFGPAMRIGLQDAELFDEPGAERIEEWITYITKWVTDAVSPELERLRARAERAEGELAEWKALAEHWRDRARHTPEAS